MAPTSEYIHISEHGSSFRCQPRMWDIESAVPIPLKKLAPDKSPISNDSPLPRTLVSNSKTALKTWNHALPVRNVHRSDDPEPCASTDIPSSRAPSPSESQPSLSADSSSSIPHTYKPTSTNTCPLQFYHGCTTTPPNHPPQPHTETSPSCPCSGVKIIPPLSSQL